MEQCEEILLRLQMSTWSEEQKENYKGKSLTPIYINKLYFFDEHHRKAVLGIANKHEYLVSQNLNGELAAEEEGGLFNAPLDRTEAKFQDKARALMGASMRMGSDGQPEGIRSNIFFYSGKTVLGLAKWQKMVETEIQRVKPLKGVWRGPGYGYFERYGGEAEGRLKAEEKVRQTHIPATDLITFMVEEVDRLSPGEDALIWHDALSQISDKSTQEWLKKQGVV